MSVNMLIAALVGAGAGGVAGGAVERNNTRDRLRVILTQRVMENPEVPQQMKDRFMGFLGDYSGMLPDLLVGLDQALLVVTDPFAREVLLAVREFLGAL